MSEAGELLAADGLVKHFDASGGLLDRWRWEKRRLVRRRRVVKALDGVSFALGRGEPLGLVGESGCGKSTLVRLLFGLQRPSRGEVRYRGRRMDRLSPSSWLPYRRRMQKVFGDPCTSFDPRMTVGEILEEPLRFHFRAMNLSEAKERVAAGMEEAGVDPRLAGRYPGDLSLEQRQRINIARALATDPELVVADDPFVPLDLSARDRILRLLGDLQRKRGFALLFLSRDPWNVGPLAHRAAVMYRGILCELAPARELFETPRHPYSRALLSAVPRPGDAGGRRARLVGEAPPSIFQPSGCLLHPRCLFANDRCGVEVPRFLPTGSGAWVACHGVEEGRL